MIEDYAVYRTMLDLNISNEKKIFGEDNYDLVTSEAEMHM